MLTGPDAAVIRTGGQGVARRLEPPAQGSDVQVVPHLTGLSATFTVRPTDKLEPDFRAKGMLRYVGERYLQFDDGDFFLKVYGVF